jgi:hypothetical protein
MTTEAAVLCAILGGTRVVLPNVVQPRPDKGRPPSHRPRFTILSRADILASPESAWLVAGLVPLDSLAVLFGPSDSFKSFLAVGVACCVASGTDFLGHEVKRQGAVVYVYAEGGRGVSKRLRAWEKHNNHEAGLFFGIAEPVDMLGDDPDKLIADIRAKTLQPALIVLDTMARCFGGGDENSTRDMSRFVSGCDALRRAFPDCTILVVHHTGYNEARARGASAWRAAVDTELKLERHDKTLLASLSITKQKDFPEPAGAIDLELLDVPGTNSAVFRLADPARIKAAKTSNDTLALAALRTAGAAGLSAAEWAGNGSINAHTLKEVRGRLVKSGLVRLEGRRRWVAIPEEEVKAAREAVRRTLGLAA